MKITKKTSKKGLVEFINETMASDKFVLKDKNLVDMANYALKKFAEDSKEVLKADLYEIASDLQAYISPEPTPVENEAKPKLAKKSKAKKEETEEKTTKKAKKAKKEVEPEPEKFPESFTSDAGELVKVEDIATIEDFNKALADNRNLFLVESWSKEDLKTFDYDPMKIATTKVKEFPNDLDLYQAVYTTEKAVFAVSVYTEMFGIFQSKDFKADKNLIRKCNNAEWVLYESK